LLAVTSWDREKTFKPFKLVEIFIIVSFVSSWLQIYLNFKFRAFSVVWQESLSLLFGEFILVRAKFNILKF